MASTFEETFVQTPAEYEENCKVVEARLRRDGAALANTARNGRALSEYLLKNYRRADGKVNATAQHMYSSVMNLHSVGMIDWVTAPAPKKKPAEVQGVTRILSASETLRKQNEEAEKLAKVRANSEFQQSEHTKVVENLALCEELFTSYRTRRATHSRTARLREQLREKFNSGRKLRMTPESAEALYQSLLAFADNYPD